MKLNRPDLSDVKPKLTVVGVGGAGCNAINNMIDSGLKGVTFVVANTDAQSLAASNAEHRVQLGMKLTEGLGAGSKPEIGHAAAEEAIEEIRNLVAGSNMVFIAGGMGGGTGTGAAAVIARAAKELGALTVGIVTKPFLFEGARRMRIAEAGVSELKKYVDTLIVIPNQNLFRLASDRTTFAESFLMADQVLYAGIACIVDLIIKEGLINLDFADVRTIMSGMGTAMMGQGEASGERRATRAAEEAILNPLLDDVSLRGAKGLLLSITGGPNLTLYEVDEAASRVRQEVDPEANIIVGATFDEELVDSVRVSIVASGMSRAGLEADRFPGHQRAADMPKGFGAPFDPRLQAAAQPPALPEAEMHNRLSQAIQHGAPTASPPLPAAYHQDPQPRAPAHPHHQPPREHWQAPGNVMIEEGPPRLSPPSHLPPPLPAGFGADPSAPDRFTPAPSAEIRRPIPRIPEVDEFPAVGQRVYRAMKGHEPGDGQFHPGQQGSAAGEPQRRLGLFERITGRMRRDSDLVKRGPARSVARSYEDDAMPAERAQAGHYAPPSDINQDIRNFEQEAEMPVFFDRTRKQS